MVKACSILNSKKYVIDATVYFYTAGVIEINKFYSSVAMLLILCSK